nr:reverse transcriptase domain-containing protein [Tanacetum cinerariifolium]
MFKQLHINITLADALILIPKYHKMLKALLSNKEKLLEMENTLLNENCSAVIVKKLPKKLGDPGKFLILYGFSELKYKALADLGASINLMPLSVWKKLVDFVIVDYESDPRVPLILGRPFLLTVRALIDVQRKEMILRDGYEKLTLNMRHDTSSYSNQPQKESINMINIFNDSSKDFLENLFATNHQSGNPTFSSHPELTLSEVKDDIFDPEGGNVLIEKVINLDSTKDLPPPHNVNPLSGSTTSSSPNHLFEKKWILEDSVDEDNLADLNDNLADTMPEMFTDEHALDYSSSPLYDEYDNDLFEVESDTKYVYNDPFDSKGKKIKESKLLINELDLLRSSDFLPSSEYDSFLFEDFSKVDALPLTNNEDKVFNPGILIQKNLSKVNTRVAPDKNVKKIAISHAFLILKDFDPPLYELPFLNKVLGSETLLSFSFKNEEKVFKPRILTSKGVHFSLLLEISHRGHKVFKIIKIIKSPMEVFPCFCGEDIHILDVPCLH